MRFWLLKRFRNTSETQKALRGFQGEFPKVESSKKESLFEVMFGQVGDFLVTFL